MKIGLSLPARESAALEAREQLAALPDRFGRLLHALAGDVYAVDGKINFRKLAKSLRTSVAAARRQIDTARRTIEMSQPD